MLNTFKYRLTECGLVFLGNDDFIVSSGAAKGYLVQVEDNIFAAAELIYEGCLYCYNPLKIVFQKHKYDMIRVIIGEIVKDEVYRIVYRLCRISLTQRAEALRSCQKGVPEEPDGHLAFYLFEIVMNEDPYKKYTLVRSLLTRTPDLPPDFYTNLLRVILKYHLYNIFAHLRIAKQFKCKDIDKELLRQIEHGLTHAMGST